MLTVRGSTLDVRIRVKRRQILTTEIDPCAVRVNLDIQGISQYIHGRYSAHNVSIDVLL